MFICRPGNRTWLIYGEKADRRQIFKVIMVGRCTAPQRTRGVCLYKLISQTKRGIASYQLLWIKTGSRSGRERAPGPPGKTRWDLGVTASITSLLTNEQFTEMTHLKGPHSVVLAVNLGSQ